MQQSSPTIGNGGQTMPHGHKNSDSPRPFCDIYLSIFDPLQRTGILLVEKKTQKNKGNRTN